MGKPAADIAQIRKYLNGELDARAMHQLERRAQDDPFLMDAIEGYQNAKGNQQPNLDDLAARLNERVSERRSRIIPFRMIGIAALVLIICSAGVWWLYQGHRPVNNPVKNEAKQPDKLQAAKRAAAADTLDKTPAKPSKQYAENVSATTKPRALARTNVTPPVIAEDKTVTPPAVSAAAPVQTMAKAKVASPVGKDKNADTTSLNEVIVMNYKSSKKKDTTRLMALREVRIKPKADTAPEQRLQANVPGVKVYPNSQSAGDLNKLVTQGNLNNLNINQLLTSRVIQGKVIAQNNGLPIQGASVKVSGTNQATKTDAAGFFSLHADTSHAKLEVSTQGYKARQVNAAAGARDSVKTIVLAPDQNDNPGETVEDVAAHPQKGWKAFKKYLKTNAVSPDKAVGVVKLSFIVGKAGAISDIEVVKGLSDAANKKAISLVKDGPGWAGNSNKRPETVTLRIKFGE